MTGPTRRDIERLLSTEEAPVPPPELARRIKREIPAGLRLDGSLSDGLARRRIGRHVPAYRQFVLLAALLFVTIALGTVGLRALIEQKAEEERQASMLETLTGKTADGKGESDAAPSGSSRNDAEQPVEAGPPAAGTLRSSAGKEWTGRGTADAAAPLSSRQGDPALTVTVTSASGTPLAGARLRVIRIDPPTAERWTGVTAADGTARLDRPQAGTYRLDASMPGFLPGALPSLRVEAGRPVRVVLALEPEAAPGAQPR